MLSLSPRDWIERMRGVMPRRRPVSPAAPKPASLPDVFELSAQVREVLLDLERRGQLRRALQMAPDRAVLAAHLAELVTEHGAEAFRDALALVDAPEARRTEPPAPQPAPAPVAPTKIAPPPPAVAPVPTKSQTAPADAAALPPEVITQLGNLNVNQWRDAKTTDGWYAPDRDGQYELFVVRSSVHPRLFKEMSIRGAVRRESQGVAAGAAMTVTVQAGKFPFKGVLALDVEKLKSITGSSFEAIHAKWDAAERKYEVKVLKAEEEKAA